MKLKGESTEEIAEILKAMGHSSRIEILLLLKKNKKMSVTQIHEYLGLTQPETSRHLSIMKSKRILLFERDGSSIYYSINKNNLVFNFIEKLLKKNEE